MPHPGVPHHRHHYPHGQNQAQYQAWLAAAAYTKRQQDEARRLRWLQQDEAARRLPQLNEPTSDLQPSREPHWFNALRVLRAPLALLGSLLMLSGATGVWTTFPVIGQGLAWTYDDYADVAFNVDLPSLAALGISMPDALASGGIVVVILALLVTFGVFNTNGDLTRGAAVLAALFVIVFLVVLAFTSGVTVGSGAWTVILGSTLAYIGGLLGRRW